MMRLPAPVRHRFYRVECQAGSVSEWRIGEIELFRQGRQLEVGGPHHFTSAWMSEGSGEEWVYVDLGAVCRFDRIVLEWIRRAAVGEIQVSDDTRQWRTIEVLRGGSGLTDEVKLAAPVTARYVRVLMREPAAPGDYYMLTEFEVWGRGGPLPQAKPAQGAGKDRTALAGGAWRVQRDSLVAAGGADIAQPGFPDQEWVVATVPGTVLTSYYNAGAIPDPNYADNQLMISDSFFHADFWYRNEFVAPAVKKEERTWLHFDGINWKADVYLNGVNLGRIEGGFQRRAFDVTPLIRAGQVNAVAVKIEKNATPGSVKEKTFQNPDKNGGALGADNPTYHASIGWDWIPTIRGRNTGIWNSVYLRNSGLVTLADPWVKTSLPLPDTSSADISIEATLHNHGGLPVRGTIKGYFGGVAFAQPAEVPAGGSVKVKVDPASHPSLRLQKPKLWWPAGYGEPNLYQVELRFETAPKVVSDRTNFQAGVRQFTYSEDGAALRLWINGRRFVPRGGNWGFGESMLRYRAREFDVAMRYHKHMNFTMVRNWVGQIGEDALYDAADRHGIVIWQDFWLANPVDGPDPDDHTLFLENVRDTILRIRNHASVGLYCGRNEGYPPKSLDNGIRAALAELHPDLHYISSSADDVVSGHGPYRAMSFDYYFNQRATPKFHSEMGMPNIVSMESLRAMMPEEAMWPQGRMWGLHDFCLTGAQGGASFQERISQSYGGADTVEEWLTLAQFVNYEGYRAMYEAQSKHRMGLLIWMSHPAWPSFVWQTYDYYFEPTAAYFGARKASEPLHIQWNPVTERVEVVNYSGGNAAGLEASAEVLNLDGTLQWSKAVKLDSPEDSVEAPIRMEYPGAVTPVHFIRLKLSQGARLISENLYWRGTETGNFRALRQLPKVRLISSTRTSQQTGWWALETKLENPDRAPAVLVKLKVVREKSADRILPALYSDNYVTLMPGEVRIIRTEVQHADARGERPRMVVEGFNVLPAGGGR
jgi:hypothetical protein